MCGRRPRPLTREQIARVLYDHIWLNGKACACGWNMWDHPGSWNAHAADALIAVLQEGSK